MREACSCGAYISTLRGRVLREWRAGHVCPPRPEDPGPQKQGSFTHTTQSDEPDYVPGSVGAPVVFAKIGFQRAE